MSISAIYILDVLGVPVISRDYRGVHRSELLEKFMVTMMEKEEDQTLTPVIQVEDTTFAFTKYKNLYFIAVVSENANMSLVFVFLHKIIEIMCDYFKEVEEESIRDNLVIMHELLDELVDFGYPQTTDSQVLMEYITQESKILKTQRKVPPTVTNAVSWRPEGLQYKKNEVFLDVFEFVDISANGSGVVVRSEINGSLNLSTKLSGMPEMRLGLNDRLLYENTDVSDRKTLVDLDDVKFHQCVRLSKFENDRTISFIPPDGQFELMSYRINTFVKPPIWVDCVVKHYPNRRIEYVVKTTSSFNSRFTATFVDILIPVPSDVDTPVFKTTYGTVSYVPEKSILKWSLKSFSGLKESSMSASFGLPSVSSGEKESLAPIQVEFEIPFLAISGMRVQYMRVSEKSGYKALVWVRYVIKNGDYHIRHREVRYDKSQNR